MSPLKTKANHEGNNLRKTSSQSNFKAVNSIQKRLPGKSVKKLEYDLVQEKQVSL